MQSNVQPVIQNNKPERNKARFILIFSLIFISIALLSASVFAYLLLRNDNIYRGIYISGCDVSGMSAGEARQLLNSAYQTPAADIDITLKAEKVEVKTTFGELGVKYDIDEAVVAAYSKGHSGNIFVRLYNIVDAGINGAGIDLHQDFDESKIIDFVNTFYEKIYQNVQEGALLVSDNYVALRSGRHGEHIDREKSAALVKDSVKALKGGIIEPEIIITSPSGFNADDIYSQINREPVNASYKLEDGNPVLIPHTDGRTIDRGELLEIVSQLEKTEETERKLPVTYTTPDVTSGMAASMLFRDELAASTTKFSTGTQNGRNRQFNMGLAAEKIDGLVLMPGQEFSFNDVVGPRNVANGYKNAHIYVNGRIEDGIGGGICQVSTTMYNAVLNADLQVAERRNHSFIVTYVPLGQDATAYYGGTDFRFVNSTGWPIKLTSKVGGNSIAITITGTDETPGKSVIISNKVLKETPFTIKYINDPALPTGTTKELQGGLNGYVVETYKSISMDGKVVSQTKLHTSRYNPCTKILLIGTKQEDGSAATTQDTAAPAPDVTSADSQATDGVPEAPAEHAAPDSPVTDSAPEAPAEHAAPDSPVTDGAPEAPAEHAAPDSPTTNGAPEAPAEHAAPDSPTTDGAPEAPADN